MSLGYFTLLPDNRYAVCAIQQAPVGILIVDEQGIIEFVNPAAEEMFACRWSEVTGSHVAKWIPQVWEHGDRQRIGGKLEAVRGNGTTFAANVSVYPCRDGCGKWHYCLTVRDEQRPKQGGSEAKQRVEEAVRLTEPDLKDLIRHQQGMIFTYREQDGRFFHRLCDGDLLYRLGLTPDAVVGKDLYQIYPSERVERLLPYYRRAWRGEAVRFEGKCDNGIYCLITLNPIWREGRVVEVVGSIVDITDTKRKEHELLEIKELLESFVNHSTDAICVMGVDGNVLRVNRAFETIFGWAEEELVGKRLPIIPPHLRDESARMLETVRSGGHISGLETVRMRKDGSLVDVSISVSVIRDSKGRVVGLASVCRDITERKRTEELLRDSEKLSVIGQLAAGLAHEIRNPLTALKGFIQLLKSRTQNDAEYFDIMLSELERIHFIVSELLVLARPQRVNFQPKDLTQLLKSVVTLMETQAIMRNVQINVSFDPDIPLVTCEENHLKQVFINILKNAIEAMPDGGLVEFRTKLLDPGRVLIQVTDQGVGIPKERLSKLGEPFYTTKENGTGLGLMVCQRIIGAHQGTLVIESETGVGTTVDIQLPVRVEPGPLPAKS